MCFKLQTNGDVDFYRAHYCLLTAVKIMVQTKYLIIWKNPDKENYTYFKIILNYV